MKKLLLALLASAVAFTIAPVARAESFTYSFAGSGLDSVLTFTATSNGSPDGSLTITHVAGTIAAGSDIPTAVAFSTTPLADPNAPCGYDCGATIIGNIQFNNQLFPTLKPALDFEGVAFDVFGLNVNIYSNNGIYQWTDSGTYQNGSNTNQPLTSSVPEPGSLLLFGTGILGLALVHFIKTAKLSSDPAAA